MITEETFTPDEIAARGTCYRIYDETGELLYVGATVDLKGRILMHRRVQPWWPSVHHIRAAHYPTATEAQLDESRAIATEQPIHNRVLTEVRRPYKTGSMTEVGKGVWRLRVFKDRRQVSRTVRCADRAEAERELEWFVGEVHSAAA